MKCVRFRHVEKRVKGKTITTTDPAVFVMCTVGSVSKAKTESLSLYQAVKKSPLVLFQLMSLINTCVHVLYGDKHNCLVNDWDM